MVDLLGKTIRVTKCGFAGELRDKLDGSLRKVETVYWSEPNGDVGIGIACPESYEPFQDDDGDLLWCIIYPDHCELVEEDSK